MSGETTILGAFEPTQRQLDAARACVDPASRVVLLDGAIRSGKTQIAARILLEWAVGQPATYLVARSTYRSLKDSTEKALLHGDGGLPPLIPPELVKEFRASDEIVRLHSGAEILFRSLEEGNLGKILNLSLGGILVDQIEEIDPGDAGERVFDTLLGRLSDPRGPRKLLCVANPAGLVSWQYRRLVDEQTRDPGVRRVHFTLRDSAENLPADYLQMMEATKRTRPHWYRSYILGEWGAFEGQAFEEFSDEVHVVEPFEIPAGWDRFESMDHGANNPTAWLLWAVDHDGNLVVADEYYSPGLVSKHAPEILRRRKAWWEVDAGWSNTCWADPSVSAKHGLERKLGDPASVETEYADHGIGLSPANNDRKAGYLRLLELLQVAQLKSAPVALEGINAGEIVDPKWASAHGHAIDAARYGAMSRPSPSEEPPPPLLDERAEALRQTYVRERELSEEMEFELGYGQTWSNSSFRCSSSTDGIECWSTLTGHGFFISRDARNIY